MSKFIVFDGIDGAGKSTQIAAVVSALTDKGIPVVTTREPGGTDFGEQLRAALLSKFASPEAQLMAMFASRYQLLKDVIQPALAEGKAVVCDRWYYSSWAYQVRGSGGSSTLFRDLISHLPRPCRPDLLFLFDCPVDVAMARVRGSRASLDVFEQQEAQTFERIRNGYLEALTEPGGASHVLSSLDSPEDLTKAVLLQLKRAGIL